jgi:hypothetical protein
MTREEETIFQELYHWVVELATTHGHAKLSEFSYTRINDVTDRASKIIAQGGRDERSRAHPSC